MVENIVIFMTRNKIMNETETILILCDVSIKQWEQRLIEFH